MKIDFSLYALRLIAYWAALIGAPVLICTVVYRLINKRGYHKAALAISLFALIVIIVLYNFVSFG
jgi:hypothetical protein